jgi:D-alanyl-D-alanine carboxypeptidase
MFPDRKCNQDVHRKSYEAFVKERLIDPLGLEHTFVPESAELSGNYAHGYFEKDFDGKLYDYSAQSPTSVWSAGNIVSTVTDQLIWLESLLGRESIRTATT